MRNVFENEINELQQGSIFSGAKADGFEGQKAYGLIVTPRCDIAKCKVPTVHYLPIVRLEDWKKNILTIQSQKDRLETSLKNLLPLLQKHAIPSHIIDAKYKLSDDDLQKSIPNQKVLNAVIDKLKNHWNLQNLDYCYSTLSDWSKYGSRIAELVDGKAERFLLLEDWKGRREYFVICLTEIYHLTFNDARKLKNGIMVRDINFENNDFFQCEDPLKLYAIEAQLSSPYIEYVTQRLSNAFFRIGIDDWENRNSIIDHLK